MVVPDQRQPDGVHHATPLQKRQRSGERASQTVQKGVLCPWLQRPVGILSTAEQLSLHHDPVILPQSTQGAGTSSPSPPQATTFIATPWAAAARGR